MTAWIAGTVVALELAMVTGALLFLAFRRRGIAAAQTLHRVDLGRLAATVVSAHREPAS